MTKKNADKTLARKLQEEFPDWSYAAILNVIREQGREKARDHILQRRLP